MHKELHPIIKELEMGFIPRFTIRLSNMLYSNKIETLDDLVKYDVRDLLKTPNIGPKSISVLEHALKKKNLTLFVPPAYKYVDEKLE